jgi:hypothetical protein
MHQLVNVTKGYGPPVRRDLQDPEVRMGPSLREAAMATDPTRGRLGAEQKLGDGHGRGELSDVGKPGDKVGMAEASLLEASLNQVEDPAMPDDVWWASS